MPARLNSLQNDGVNSDNLQLACFIQRRGGTDDKDLLFVRRVDVFGRKQSKDETEYCGLDTEDGLELRIEILFVGRRD